jgi:hypothetical protein
MRIKRPILVGLLTVSLIIFTFFLTSLIRNYREYTSQFSRHTNGGQNGKANANTGYESLRLNPLMAIDNERDRKNGKLRVEIVRGTKSEVMYLAATNWVASGNRGNSGNQ